jgi:hypothetical protein
MSSFKSLTIFYYKKSFLLKTKYLEIPQVLCKFISNLPKYSLYREMGALIT